MISLLYGACKEGGVEEMLMVGLRNFSHFFTANVMKRYKIILLFPVKMKCEAIDGSSVTTLTLNYTNIYR